MPTLIIAGGRDYKPIQPHVDILNKVVSSLKIDKIITGECDVLDKDGNHQGADYYGKLYANHYNIKYQGFPADWKTFGLPAGPMRNIKMALQPDVIAVFLFPGGKGTSSMRECAIKCKLAVFDINSNLPV